MSNIHNIYFSGPDGSNKTSLSLALYEWLRFRGESVELFSFPSSESVVAGIIHNRLIDRVTLHRIPMASLFVSDRLDTIFQTAVPKKNDNPDTIFIFDRGPQDAKVYNHVWAVSQPNKKQALRWMRKIDCADDIFLELHPVDFGILCMSTLEQAREILKARYGVSRSDSFERDMGLQRKIRTEFKHSIRGKENWMTLPVPDKTADEAKREMMGTILREVAKRMGRPEWVMDETKLGREIGFLAVNATENGLRLNLTEDNLVAYRVTMEGNGYRGKER